MFNYVRAFREPERIDKVRRCIGAATAAAAVDDEEGRGFEKMRKEQELLPCSSV